MTLVDLGLGLGTEIYCPQSKSILFDSSKQGIDWAMCRTPPLGREKLWWFGNNVFAEFCDMCNLAWHIHISAENNALCFENPQHVHLYFFPDGR